MSRDVDLKEKKKIEIRSYFDKLNSVTEYGVKKYTIAYCTAACADKFFLRPKTIEFYLYSNQ